MKDSNDDGLSLIEVLIAVVIFSVIALGVAFTVASTLRVADQAQAREQAANLAAQDIDLDRSIDNLFDLYSDNYDTVVNGTTFHVARTASWVTDGTVNQRCGTGGGVLRYKRVNVDVTWDGMTSTTAPVQSDTLIDPGTRINDQTHGTILVSVVGSAGTGTSGVTVTATPSATPNGATALTSAPDPTDPEGCTYILSVTPGNYDVKISRAGYVDVNQSATATVTVGVQAAGAASVGFQFDQSGNLTTSYASNYSGSVLTPSNLPTSFVSTYGTYTATTPVTASGVNLYPFPSGYKVLAGQYVDPATAGGGCAAPDPSQWSAGTALNNTTVLAGNAPSTPVTPGGSAAAAVPMGVFTVKSIAAGVYVTAVQLSGPAASGDPGCAAADASPTTYTYKFPATTSSTKNFALPWGTYKIYTSTLFGILTTRVATANLTTITGSGGTNSSNGGTLTLDPRAVAP
ncbi:prepilin-type N-terminal cleavage/methylation domain-containing protein [Galbitalea soli]|uniref:Prepilin-type N-terminal cleavage/methylation domain-containing protein n=1 Tax=Galbitalea soli TaxID=1268042 RepID=A0A7C9TR36_9MICO|nr:prepilin-type N-terminal cleavage/methylation domain-containing protein [Galbitalea soli]NEM91200.1 prepilin-type N-terminal cleavage/methylation domain-containing protein [Galbitalea soli]NYJ29889.1 prepilin-type N-terminal cleavage/methylation domain-containing protein [Galbitalea soli]